MSCFCQTSLVPLAQALPALDLSASGNLSLSATAQAALSLDAWLSANAAIGGLNPAWLSMPVPALGLSANAVMTVSLMAQLQTQVLAQLGINVLTPGGAVAFARLAATLDARISALGGIDVPMGGWSQLATLNAALMRIQAAVGTGAVAAFTQSAAASASLSLSPAWASFFAQVSPLSAMVTAIAQLNVSSAADFTAALSAMANLSLPALPSANLISMCQLSAGLSAVAQLGASLGVSPLQIGFPDVRAMVAANLSATIAALASVGVTLTGSLAANLAASTSAGLPVIPGFASTAGVQAALSLDPSAFASLSTGSNVSSMLQVGLSASALAANLGTALNIGAASAPCPICDCRAIVAGLAVGASI